MPASNLISCFKPYRSWQPIHSAGQAAISVGAQVLFSTLDDLIVISDLSTGSRLHTIDGDSSPVSSICSTTAPPDAQPATLFLIAYRSLSISIYALQHLPNPARLDLLSTTPRAHAAPISVSRADPSASLFATGDTAGVVRVWDARAGHCTHVFKGHSGIISALSFDVDLPSNRTRLAVGSADCRIRLWNLATQELVGVFEGGHVSIVRGLEISADGRTMVSGSRDKVLNVWSLSESDRPGQILKTIPVYETIEAIGLVYASSIPSSTPHSKPQARLASKKHPPPEQSPLMVYTAGDKGLVRLWNLDSGLLVATEEDGQSDESDAIRVGISDARLDPVTNTLLVNKIDQTFSLLRMPDLKLVRQVVGSHDEIIDISLLKSSASAASASHLAVATNSALVRVLNLGLAENDCRLLAGHRDIVLCLATSRDQRWFVSGSKDKTARIWTMSDLGETDGQARWRCAAICEGHVQSLGAVSVAEFVGPNGQPATLLATASQDRTVKLWDLSSLAALEASGERGAPAKLASVLTLKIHDKDINATDFSDDCTLFASGSQDRLGKVFSVEHSGSTGTGLTLLAVLKGHQRGIWTVKFCPNDSFVATGSGDCTIKLWSTDRRELGGRFGSCVKTLEGHSNAILRLGFVNAGTQIVSSSSDGLVKVWDTKTQVCVSTLGDEGEDEEPVIGGPARQGVSHEGKVWAMEVEEKEEGIRLVTGGADGKIICWEDVSELVEAGRVRQKEVEVELNQTVENFIRVKDFGAVVRLMIKLDKPARLLRLLSDLGAGEDGEEFGEQDWTSATGSAAVDMAIGALGSAETIKLLDYVRGWNSMTKTCEVAQRVLNVIVKSQSWMKMLDSINESYEADYSSIGVEAVEWDSEQLEGKKKSNHCTSKGEVKKLIDGLLPYNERHLVRVEKSCQDGFVVEYMLEQMGGI